MAQVLLKARLALELPHINAALERVEKKLPATVRPVAHHIFAAGGKRLRPLLTVITAHLFGCHRSDLYDLAVSLEMLHAATLLHDDVIDNADLRRGKPAAHTIFSPTATILAGDALLAEGNALVAGFDDPALSHCFAQATSETCAGEIAEIGLQRNPLVSLEEYLAIITGKTARLISCACEMGALVAKVPQAVREASSSFGENIGIAFQLVDDAIDFANEKETGKPSGGDLREGKMTLPLRLYREQLDSVNRAAFDEKFRNNGFSLDECQVIAKCIRDNSFDTKTRTYADTYLSKAVSALDAFPAAPEKELLHEMTVFVRDRKK